MTEIRLSLADHKVQIMIAPSIAPRFFPFPPTTSMTRTCIVKMGIKSCGLMKRMKFAYIAPDSPMIAHPTTKACSLKLNTFFPFADLPGRDQPGS